MTPKPKPVELSPEELAAVRRSAERALKHFASLAEIAQSKLGLPSVPLGPETKAEIVYRPYNSRTIIRIYSGSGRLLSASVYDDPPGVCRPPRKGEGITSQ